MRSKASILFILSFVVFTDCVDFMMIMPLGDVLMRKFDISAGQFSLLVSSYTIAAGISAFLASLFLDLFDRKKALMAVYFGFALGTTLCGFAYNYPTLIISRSVTGVFGGLMSALVIAIVSDIFHYEKRGKALGIVMSAFSVASVAGIPMGLYLAGHSGWFIPYRVVGVLAFVCFVSMYFILPPLRSHLVEGARVKSPIPFLAEVGKDSNQMYALLMFLFLIMGHFMIVPFIPSYLVRNVGFKQEQLQYVYIVGGIVTLISGPIVGWLTDKYGARRVFTVAMILSTIPVALVTHLKPQYLPAVLVVTGVFFIFAHARNIPSNTISSAAVHPEKRGSFMSLRTCMVELTSGFAAAISGMIVVEKSSGQLLNYDFVGYIAIICTLISLYMALKVRKVTDH